MPQQQPSPMPRAFYLADELHTMVRAFVEKQYPGAKVQSIAGETNTVYLPVRTQEQVREELQNEGRYSLGAIELLLAEDYAFLPHDPPEWVVYCTDVAFLVDFVVPYPNGRDIKQAFRIRLRVDSAGQLRIVE